MSDDYYKLYLADNQVKVVNLQWADEAHYNPDKLLDVSFDDERQAERIAERLNIVCRTPVDMLVVFDVLKDIARAQNK